MRHFPSQKIVCPASLPLLIWSSNVIEYHNGHQCNYSTILLDAHIAEIPSGTNINYIFMISLLKTCFLTFIYVRNFFFSITIFNGVSLSSEIPHDDKSNASPFFSRFEKNHILELVSLQSCQWCVLFLGSNSSQIFPLYSRMARKEIVLLDKNSKND